MEESILETVRAFIGLAGVDAFDHQILPLINSSINTLNQHGAGVPIYVEDTKATWNDFRGPVIPVRDLTSSCKTYVMLKVKQLFDPPAPNTAGYVASTLDELLWNIKEAYNTPEVLREL